MAKKRTEYVPLTVGADDSLTTDTDPSPEAVAVQQAMVQSSVDEPGAGQRFLALAERLVAVPKHEVDALRHPDDAAPA